MNNESSVMNRLDETGFTILPKVVDASHCQSIIHEISEIMSSRDSSAIASGRGQVVGGRNLLQSWSGWRQIVATTRVRELIAAKVGTTAGVVRILFFDKPPGRGWSLALHKDKTIAVAEHRQPEAPFSKPTRKAGVAHVEANEPLLSRMLTLRLHLDAMHNDNGPLIVVPSSHQIAGASPTTTGSPASVATIACEAGDVFAMRPLLSHGSRAASADTNDHRRVVHLEIAPEPELPGGYEWHQFESL